MRYIRERGSLNRELQHTSQGLLVTRREVLSLFSQLTRCDQAGFTFVCSAGTRGDQNAVSLDDIYNIYIYRGLHPHDYVGLLPLTQ